MADTRDTLHQGKQPYDIARAQNERATPPPRPSLTLSQAESACGVSRSTLRRALDSGRFPDAWRDIGAQGPDTGPWRIPVDSLISAGYHPNRAEPVLSYGMNDVMTHRDEQGLDSVELRLARAEGQVERWRDVAEERSRVISVLEQALRALPAAPTTTQLPSAKWGSATRTAIIVAGALIAIATIAGVVVSFAMR